MCVCVHVWWLWGIIMSRVHRQQVLLHWKCPVQLREAALHLVWAENAQPPRQEGQRGGRILHHGRVWAGCEPRGGNRLVSPALTLWQPPFAPWPPSFFCRCLFITKPTEPWKYLLFWLCGGGLQGKVWPVASPDKIECSRVSSMWPSGHERASSVDVCAVVAAVVSSASLSRELWPYLRAPSLGEEAQEDHQDPEEVHQQGTVPPPLCRVGLWARQESEPASGTAGTLRDGAGADRQEMW